MVRICKLGDRKKNIILFKPSHTVYPLNVSSHQMYTLLLSLKECDSQSDTVVIVFATGNVSLPP